MRIEDLITPEKFLINIKLIETNKDLNNIIDILKLSTEIALDLEFDDNNNQIGKKLSIIQIYDNKQTYIIDVIKLKDIEILSEIIDNENIIKIFHCCDSDIFFLHKHNLSIKNVIDTNTLNKYLFGINQDISLKNLVFRELNIELDKSEQKSNWLKRPLTVSQIKYSANDVKYLFELKESLINKLEINNIYYKNCEDIILQKDNYLELEMLLDKLSKKYNKFQYELLTKRELQLLLNKKIYETQYLTTIFRRSMIKEHITDLSIIIKKMLNIKEEPKIIKTYSDDELIHSEHSISVYKKMRKDLLLSYASEYGVYFSSDDLKFAVYCGYPRNSNDVNVEFFKFLDDNNINNEFVTTHVINVFKNSIKYYKDETGE